MPRYLSAEWIAALQSAASAVTAANGEPAGGPVTIEQNVVGGPDGDVTYHLIVAADGVRLEAGAAENATVTFTQDYATAAAIAAGELSAQSAFMVGRVRVRGDLQALVANQNMLARLDDLSASVRRETTY